MALVCFLVLRSRYLLTWAWDENIEENAKGEGNFEKAFLDFPNTPRTNLRTRTAFKGVGLKNYHVGHLERSLGQPQCLAPLSELAVVALCLAAAPIGPQPMAPQNFQCCLLVSRRPRPPPLPWAAAARSAGPFAVHAEVAR